MNEGKETFEIPVHPDQIRSVATPLDKTVRRAEQAERREQMAAHGALRKEVATAKSNYGKSLRELRRLAGKTQTARKALGRAFDRSGFKLRQAMDLVAAAERATMELDEGPELDALKKALEEYLSLVDSVEEAQKVAEQDLEDYDKAWSDYEALSREVGVPLIESFRPPQEDQIGDALDTPSARAARVPNQVLDEPAPKPTGKKREELSAEEKERAVFALLDKLASKARAGAEAPVEQPKEARKGKAKPKDARETKAKPKKADAKKVSDAVKKAGKKGSVESKLAADDAKGRPLESDQGIGDKDIHC